MMLNTIGLARGQLMLVKYIDIARGLVNDSRVP